MPAPADTRVGRPNVVSVAAVRPLHQLHDVVPRVAEVVLVDDLLALGREDPAEDDLVGPPVRVVAVPEDRVGPQHVEPLGRRVTLPVSLPSGGTKKWYRCEPFHSNTFRMAQCRSCRVSPLWTSVRRQVAGLLPDNMTFSSSCSGRYRPSDLAMARRVPEW